MALCPHCQHAVTDPPGGPCPNCGGDLVRRPIRPAEKLLKHPASTTRKVKPAGRVAA